MLPDFLQAQTAPLQVLLRAIKNYSLKSRRQSDTLIKHEHSVLGDGIGNQNGSNPIPVENPDMQKRYWRHGYDLLQTALLESQLQHINSHQRSRDLYVNAASYIIQGLPTTLTEKEIAQLQQALPTPLQTSRPDQLASREPKTPSILHRGIATMIVLLCFILRVALPYLRYLLAIAYNYERTHHVAEKALAIGIATADSLGKQSVIAAGFALENKLIMSILIYCAEGICGGLNEGLGQGRKDFEATTTT